MSLIHKLTGALEGSREETRLQMLIEAVELWDARQGNATGSTAS